MTARRTRLAALLAASALSASALAGCGSDDDQAQDLPNTTDPSQSASDATSPSGAGPTSSSPSDPSASAPTESSSGSSDGQVAVPAYFVGKTPLGDRLYREFQRVPAEGAADEALALIASDAALDPDYFTLLPGDGAPTLTSHDDTAVVALPDSGWQERPTGMTAAEAQLAVQQIVHTVQGVLQEEVPVSFVGADGQPSAVFGLTAPDGGFTAGKFDKVLALVNVTTPEEGQSVSGTLAASGVGSSFEGTIVWEIDDASGSEVLDGSAQADGWIDDLYPWTTDIDISTLSPGSYTFVAHTDDPSGGEGPGPTKDTKTFTVQ